MLVLFLRLEDNNYSCFFIPFAWESDGIVKIMQWFVGVDSLDKTRFCFLLGSPLHFETCCCSSTPRTPIHLCPPPPELPPPCLFCASTWERKREQVTHCLIQLFWQNGFCLLHKHLSFQKLFPLTCPHLWATPDFRSCVSSHIQLDHHASPLLVSSVLTFFIAYLIDLLYTEMWPCWLWYQCPSWMCTLLAKFRICLLLSPPPSVNTGFSTPVSPPYPMWSHANPPFPLLFPVSSLLYDLG